MRKLRRKVRARARLASAPTATRGKTGQPEWFRKMKAETAMREALKKLPLVELAAIGPVLANRLRAAGYDSVWALSQASLRDLLDIPQVGVSTLRRVHAELTARNVATKWEAPRG